MGRNRYKVIIEDVKRGYVDDPTHWSYSSARNYAEQESLLEVCMEW